MFNIQSFLDNITNDIHKINVNGKRESDEKKVNEINKKRFEQLNDATGSSETDPTMIPDTSCSGDLQSTQESRPAIENMSMPEMDFDFFLDNVIDLDEIFGASANSESDDEDDSEDDEDEDEDQANVPIGTELPVPEAPADGVDKEKGDIHML
jgi:hypothetical protein